MPAGSEGTECGQRNSQRLSHHDRTQKRPPRRREAVLFRPVCCTCRTGGRALARYWVRSRWSLTLSLVDGQQWTADFLRLSSGCKPLRLRQTRDGPGGGFGEDRIVSFGVGPGFELGQKFPLAAVAHGDGDVAQQSAAFCSLYGGTSKLTVELFRSQAGEPCERRIDEFRPGEIGRTQLSRLELAF